MPRNFSNVEYPQPAPPHTRSNSLEVLELFKLKGKVASITGASMGIGWAVAEAFAQAGADVAIWYNSHNVTDKTTALAEKYGIRARAYKANMRDASVVKEVIEQQIKDFGHLDIVIANAGIAWTKGTFIDQPGDQDFDDVIDINLKGVAYVAKYAGRHFKERFDKEAKRGSFIVTTSVSATLVNTPQRQAPYNAAKAAVRQFVKSLAVEWAAFARANSVSPGFIKTEILGYAPQSIQDNWWSQVPLGRVGATSEIVGAYLLLASDAGSYCTGTDLIVDGGYTLP